MTARRSTLERTPASGARPEVPGTGSWHPGRWRACPVEQSPVWSEPELHRAVRALRACPPLVTPAEIRRLRRELATAASGGAFVLQAGDCLESFATQACTAAPEAVRFLRGLARRLSAHIGMPVVTVARMAGQYAKPRSHSRDSAGLPVFRGEAVNAPDADAAARRPDAGRLLSAYHKSAETAALLRLAGAPGRGGPPVWTSHEALLLPYEEALTRRDPAVGRWYDSSTHLPWIGDRTRAPGGGHVEFASGIANPVGVKLGPTTTTDELAGLCARLDPERASGRLVLVCRLSADRVADLLPPLVESVRRRGHRPLWMCDPMHGNTIRRSRSKVRRFDDIERELATFVRVVRRLGAVPGGVHLEATGSPVGECLGGSPPVTEQDLAGGYRSLCDPRLNGEQTRLLLDRLTDTMRAA